MNFSGPARPLEETDVLLIAGYLGCHIAAVRAVLAVESAGKGFGPGKRPIILNEPHIFYRELAGAAREKAVKDGLAYPVWGAKPYLKTQEGRYSWLNKAMAINETAALRSCSWGLGQVMGFNHKAAGYNTVQQFVEAMTISEGAHLYAMARFIVSKGLQGHLRDLNWVSFALGYNGTGYAKNKYDVKMAQAYAKRPASEKWTPPPTTEAQLNALATGQAAPELPRDRPPEVRGDTDIWTVQTRLKAMNYSPGGLDGLWGGMTAGAITAFINDRRLPFPAPTSAAMFRETLANLNDALTVAEAERYTRPIAPERSEATSDELAKKLPEVESSKKAERVGFWTAIGSAISTAVTAIVAKLGDAVEWLTPLKSLAGEIPWFIWVAAALAGSGLIYYVSLKAGDAKNEATTAFQEGNRT
jgi:hypothetical protein